MDFYIPIHINEILTQLETKGEAFIVGGCVRDLLLGNVPSDYDITTNLKPEEVIGLFKGHKFTNKNGLKHGTVSLIYNNEIVEITTYRCEGKYIDGRHPSEISYSNSLREDLVRRDFTINALAYNPKTGIIDYFEGQKDLKEGIVRAIGNPYQRFSEDYLRILRALRFASRYGFVIEEKTAKALKDLANNLTIISSERIMRELEEILVSKDIFRYLLAYKEVFLTIIPELKSSVNFDQKSIYHKDDVYTHIAYVVSYTKPIFPLRMAALLHDISKPYCFQEEVVDGRVVRHFSGHPEKAYLISQTILSRLKVSKEFREKVLYLVLNHDYIIKFDRLNIKRLLLKTPNHSLELFSLLLDLKKADEMSHAITMHTDFVSLYNLAEDIVTNDVLNIKDLQIKGYDLASLGVCNSFYGQILKMLLEEVITGKLINKKEELVKRAKEISKNCR